MKHNFSTEDLEEAITHAHSKSFDMPPVTASELRFMLDALPEPATDDWQECSIHQVRNGEIFRARYHNGTVIEAEAKAIGPGYIGVQKHQTLATVEASDVEQFYRIPATVQHPDPKENPVIIIYRPNGNGEIPVSYAWTGQHYRSFDGQEYFSADEITDWTPGKVVEDDR